MCVLYMGWEMFAGVLSVLEMCFGEQICYDREMVTIECDFIILYLRERFACHTGNAFKVIEVLEQDPLVVRILSRPLLRFQVQ